MRGDDMPRCDRIAVGPIHTDTIVRLHAEAEATGRSIADIAADLDPVIDTYVVVVDVTPTPTPAIDPGGTQGPIQPIQPTTQETTA